nr:hypothetical protein [Spirochaetaceae bacterium]
WLNLAFLYFFFSKSFQKNWLPGLAIPFLCLGTLLSLFTIIPYLYIEFPLVFFRRILDWEIQYGNILFGLFLLVLLIRLIIALIREEAFRLWAVISLVFSISCTLWMFFRNPALSLSDKLPVMFYGLVPLLFMGLMRLFLPSPNEKSPKREPQEERLFSELQQSKEELKQLQQDLNNEDSMMGHILEKSRRLRDSLLPQTIHPDKFWEVALFYQPENSEQRDYYDFFYSYSRHLRAAVFFDIQNGMNGSFTGSYLKGVLPEEFNRPNSLSSLYRSLTEGTKSLREGRDLNGLMLRFNQNELEYTGWNNAPMLFRANKRNKAALLIQDKTINWENLKSYRIQVEAGDSILITNDLFYNAIHPVTEDPYGVARAVETLDTQQGRATEILKNLIRHRQQYYGDSRFNKGVFLLVLKRKTD